MADGLDDVLEVVEDTTQQEQPQVNTAIVEDEEEIPEKYRGKTPKELIKMHRESEKLHGKLGSEVGELRKVIDNYIKTQTFEKSKTDKDTTVEDSDFYVEPTKAVSKVVDSHPAIQEAKRQSLELKREATLAKFNSFPKML